MSRAWGLLKRKKVETDFRLLTEQEAIDTISKRAGISGDVAARALTALDTYENTEYFRSDQVASWLEQNANRLRFSAQGRGA
ncbi:MAG: hypothetical protein WA542_19210 [Candidatus Acidiferrum sp.]